MVTKRVNGADGAARPSLAAGPSVAAGPSPLACGSDCMEANSAAFTRSSACVPASQRFSWLSTPSVMDSTHSRASAPRRAAASPPGPPLPAAEWVETLFAAIARTCCVRSRDCAPTFPLHLPCVPPTCRGDLEVRRQAAHKLEGVLGRHAQLHVRHHKGMQAEEVLETGLLSRLQQGSMARVVSWELAGKAGR